MRSCLYTGRVDHVRSAGIAHAFGYRHALLCLDLDELPHVFDRRWLWSVEKPNVASFRRRDYLGDASVPLADAVRARVRAELGREPRGHIAIVTQPRLFGRVFNPVTFYFCRAEDGTLDAIVAEITNTPWNERHAYVLDARVRQGERVCARFAKRFHVSPFQPMELEYAWDFTDAGERLDVRMESFADGAHVFRAELALERRPLDGPALGWLLAAYPGLSVRTLAAIYFEALRLKLKGAHFHPHPSAAANDAAVEPR